MGGPIRSRQHFNRTFATNPGTVTQDPDTDPSANPTTNPTTTIPNTTTPYSFGRL